MTTKITIKFIKPNAVFESSAAAYDDKKALYSDEAKESIDKNHAILQELNTFTAPIQPEWAPESFTLYIHKFIDPEQIALYWAIHQLIIETTNSQPTNGWNFIDIVETRNYSAT